MVPLSRRPVKRTILSSCTSTLLNRIMVLAVGTLVLFIVALLSESSSFIHAKNEDQQFNEEQLQTKHRKFNVLTADQLKSLIADVAGDDKRIMRWDATEHTASRQAVGGACDALPDAFFTLLSVSVARKRNSHNNSPEVREVQGLACEYATFCITDNPVHRASLHHPELNGVHQIIVNLTRSLDSYTSAMACHVIYIASFANAENHALFYEAEAVPALAALVKHSDDNKDVQTVQVRPVQIMWAAAALQNLAASYCATPDDGRCYWDWRSSGTSDSHIQITKDSLPLITDGSHVRYDMLSDTALVERLVQLTCQGPVTGKRSSVNPFPGVNAVAGEHDDSSNIVPWAAAGAIKNLALGVPSTALTNAVTEASLVMLQSAVPCLCRMAHVSRDWLEQNKGQGALHHLRRGGSPCWFGKHGDDYKNGKLCVDRVFLDAEGYTCADYGDASEEECAKANEDNVTPNQACCGCGGGEREIHGRRTEEL